MLPIECGGEILVENAVRKREVIIGIARRAGAIGSLTGSSIKHGIRSIGVSASLHASVSFSEP